MKKEIQAQIQASIDAKKGIPIGQLMQLVQVTIAAYQQGKKTLFMGNGGSAADAQHLAAEFVARFKMERRGLPSLALHTNTSTITAWANDYEYESAYARSIEAFAQAGDIVIGISTSGNSKNIIRALQKAKELDCVTVGFTGKDGGEMKAFCDILLNISVDDTPRIQESHILMGHIYCDLVEKGLFS